MTISPSDVAKAPRRPATRRITAELVKALEAMNVLGGDELEAIEGLEADEVPF